MFIKPSRKLAHGVAFVSAFILLLLVSFGAYSEPLLWQVKNRSSNSQASVYLFGSIHFGVESMYPLPDAVNKAFANSDYLAVEANVLNLDPVKTMQVLQSHGMYSDGTTLKNHIDADTWRELEMVVGQLPLPVETFLPMRPWLVALQLVSFQLLQSQLRQDLGIDFHFLQRAQGNKSILELESFESQIQLFADLTPEEETYFLRQTLRDFSLGLAYLQELSDAWTRGDREALEALVLDSFTSTAAAGKLYDKVFVQRNENMLVAVESYLRDSKTVFYVVGIGHMIGPDGLVSMLRDKGYSVSRQ